MRITSNEPLVHTPLTLSRLLREHWFPAGDWDFEVCDGRIRLFGRCQPLVYRIPNGEPSAMFHPGKATGAPVELDGFLVEVAPFLRQPLIVQILDDNDAGVTGWTVTPGIGTVKRDVYPNLGHMSERDTNV